MVCDKIRDEILDIRDERGEYDDRVKEHLEGCVKCQGWEKTMAEAGETLSKLDGPALPQDFARKLAARAVEEQQRGLAYRVKRTFSSVLAGTADLLLGPGRVPQYSLTLMLLWGAVLAAVASTTAFTMMYIMQADMKSWLLSATSLASVQMMKNTLWIPFLTESWHGHFREFFTCGVSLLSMAVIVFTAFRVLNLRAFFTAVWKRKRIPPTAVILPLLGIVITVLAMNYFMIVLQFLLYGRYYPSFSDVIGPYYLNNSPLPLPLAMFLNYINPFISPALGWNLSIAAFLILMFCSARNVHSMVRFFYGALGSAALFQVISKTGACYDHYGLFSSIWSYGVSGIIPLKALSLSILLAVAFSAAAFVLILSSLGFDDNISMKTLMKKRLIPSMSVILLSSVIVTALISPVAGRVIAARNGINAENAFYQKSTNPIERREEISTVVALTSDCDKAPDRYMKGRMKPYNVPAGLFDEKRYRDMQDVLNGPLSPKSYTAISYLVCSDLAKWDQRSALAHSFQWFEAQGRERFWGKYYYTETLFYNGMTRDEIDQYLDRISDGSRFFAGSEVKEGMTSVYASLGEKAGFSIEKKKDGSREIRNRHTFYSGPLDGAVSGALVVNGAPCADTKVRLFSPYNFYYYDNTQPCPSEEEFIYQLDLSLWNEVKKMDRYSFSGYGYGACSSLPVITATTDRQGRFHFSNLAEGNYYMVVRFPGALNSVTQKTPVGIISITSSKKAVDLGSVKLDVERGK
ncbi:MAG: hypothetical protein AB2L14_31370 [Candidatus Xenobiia bacterium LiM19]